MRRYGLPSNTAKSRRLWWIPVFMLFLALVSSAWVTQSIARAYMFHPALGSPVFKHIYTPWSWVVWRSRYGDSHGVIADAIAEGQLVFILPLLFVLVVAMAFSRQPKGRDDLHGSAHWAGKKDIINAGLLPSGGKLEATGVVVGGWLEKGIFTSKTVCLRHNGPEHILCFAPTRSGKGVGLILPTLFSWPGSSIILDIKGENWALTSGWRQSQGHRVLRFDPADSSGSGCAFNPLDEIRLTSLEAVQDVQNLALMLVDPDGKGLDDHWSKAAFAFFSGLILHCCIKIKAEGRTATLRDLTLMMSNPDGTTQELLDEMLTAPHADLFRKFAPDADERVGDACHVFIASSAREMLSKSNNEASGVLSSALVNMALYRDPIVAINTAHSDFHIHDLMNHEAPVNLYLVVAPDAIDRMRPLIRLMLDMIVRRVCAKMEFADGASKAGYKHRLLFMLDEFTSLGKLPIMEKAIAYIAGYGGKIYLIVQDIIQLNGVYGKDNALMANCHVRIAYAPNTVETAEVLSKMTGTTTVVEQKTSLSGARSGHLKNVSVSSAETARPLLTPDECMRIPGISNDKKGNAHPGDMLIFVAGRPPVYGRQLLYFKDPTLLSRAKIPAPKESDRLIVEIQRQKTILSSDGERMTFARAMSMAKKANHKGAFHETRD